MHLNCIPWMYLLWQKVDVFIVMSKFYCIAALHIFKSGWMGLDENNILCGDLNVVVAVWKAEAPHWTCLTSPYWHTF